jgi:hypothetical protein
MSVNKITTPEGVNIFITTLNDEKNSRERIAGAMVSDQEIVLSAMHKKKKKCHPAKFKQSFCAPGVKTSVKLDGPAAVAYESGLATVANPLTYGAAPLGYGAYGAAPLVNPVGFGYSGLSYAEANLGFGYPGFGNAFY